MHLKICIVMPSLIIHIFIFSSIYVAVHANHSRGEGGVNLCPQVVRVENEHANHECEEDHDEEDHELEDVLHGSSQRDLQRPEALIGWEE